MHFATFAQVSAVVLLFATSATAYLPGPDSGIYARAAHPGLHQRRGFFRASTSPLLPDEVTSMHKTLAHLENQCNNYLRQLHQDADASHSIQGVRAMRALRLNILRQIDHLMQDLQGRVPVDDMAGEGVKKLKALKASI